MILGGGKALLSGSGVNDQDAKSIIARMSPPPNLGRKRAIDRLVQDLKKGGVWANLQQLFILSAHTEQAALLNWRMNASATKVGSFTIATDRGWNANAGACLRTNDQISRPSLHMMLFARNQDLNASDTRWSMGARYERNAGGGSSAVQSGLGIGSQTSFASSLLLGGGSPYATQKSRFPGNDPRMGVISARDGEVPFHYLNGIVASDPGTPTLDQAQFFNSGTIFVGAAGGDYPISDNPYPYAASTGLYLTTAQCAAFDTAMKRYMQHVGVLT